MAMAIPRTQFTPADVPWVVADPDTAFRVTRDIELDRNDLLPAGVEVHADGNVWHEVQAGDGWIAIKRDYERGFAGLKLGTWQSIAAANPQITDGYLRPGQLAEIPELEYLLDQATLARHPNLRIQGTYLLHEVGAGENLVSIARHYAKSENLRVTWKDIARANPDLATGGPANIPPGTRLSIPGITFESPRDSHSDILDLDGASLVTRAALNVANGDVSTREVMNYYGDTTSAYNAGYDVNVAMDAARWITGASSHPSTSAVVLARDSSYWVVPLEGLATGTASTGTHEFSPAMRRDDRSVVAVSERATEGGPTSLRRFDT